VSDVGDRIALRQADLRGRQALVDLADRVGRVAPPAACRPTSLLQSGEEIGVRDRRSRLPFGAQRGQGARRLVLAGRDDTDRVAVASDDDAGHSFRRLRIDGDERGTERSRSQHLAVEHSGELDVRCIPVPAGHKDPPVHLQGRAAGDLPLLRGRGRRVALDGPGDLLALRE
jgi:hypothetical protein